MDACASTAAEGESEGLSALSIDSGAIARRTLSANDCSGKRRRPLRRSSVSDLSDECFTPNAEDELPEIECKLRYCELVSIPGVSDIPLLNSADIDDVPPSAPIGAGSFRKLPIPQVQAKAVASLKSPHKLLIVTRDFCELFGYTAVDSEICGRDLKMLFGPRTDIAAVSQGMQSAAMIETASHSVALYTRDGDCLVVEATFSPYLIDSDTLAGCLLDLRIAPDH